MAILLEIGWHVSMEKYSEALSAIEPNVPWERQLLARRAEAYARTRHPLAARANRDLALFEKREPRPFDAGLAAPAQGAR